MLGVLKESEVESLLRTQLAARLGCHAEGQTYVVPISYAYDGSHIFSDSVDGRKLRMMRLNPEVCVEIDQVENLGNWQSVIAWGRFEELHEKDALMAAQLLLERFGPLMTSKANQPTHGLPGIPNASSSPVFFCIQLREKTGRFEKQNHLDSREFNSSCESRGA